MAASLFDLSLWRSCGARRRHSWQARDFNWLILATDQLQIHQKQNDPGQRLHSNSGSTWFDGPTVTCGADGPFRRTNIWCYLSPNFWCKKVRKKHLKPVIRHCFFKAKLRVITKYLILIHCGMAWIVHLACLPRAALLLEIPSAHFCSSADPSWRRDTPAAPVHLVLGSVRDKSNLM